MTSLQLNVELELTSPIIVKMINVPSLLETKKNTNIEWVPPDMAEHYATKYNNPFVFHLKPTTTIKKAEKIYERQEKKK